MLFAVLIPEVSSVTSTAAIEPEVESDTGAVSEPAAAVLTDSTGTSPQLPAEVNLQAAQTLEASSGPVNVPQPEVAQSAQDALAETPPIEQIMDEQAQTNSPVARPPIPPQSKWGVIRGRPSATACIICFDDGSHHIQAQCPVVKAGADALVPTLEARRAMPPSRDRSLSIEAIKNWLNRLETIAARVRGGEGNQRVGQPMIYEQVLPNGNGSHGAVRAGQQDAASSPTAAEVTLPSSVPSDALAEPSATTPQPTFTVLPQPTSVPAVTPIAPTSLPNGNLPLGIHLRALAKPRKNGSISGVSASSAIIETEPSDSESSDSENGENDSDESQGEGDSGSEDDDRPIIKRRRVQGADASDDEGTTSGTDSMSASDSDSNDGSDDSDTDSISTPPAGDPAELLQQIMSRPLSQRERRKARQSAASMLGGVAITPDASEAGDTVSESESEPEMEGKVFRAQGRRGSDSSIGDFVDLVDGDQVGGAGGETVESVVSEPEDEDEEPIIPSSLVEPPAFSAGETEPQLRSQNDESESAGDALPKNKSRSSRSFHDLEAEAGDSPDVDSFPGVVALDEARVEEDRPEMEAMEGVMQSTESREVVEGNGEAVATQPNGLARDLVQDLEETTPTAPRRRGRPPKVRPPSESAVDEPQASIQPSQQSDLPPSQPNDSSAPLSTELAAAPKRRGRPPKSKPDAAAPPTPASPLLADSLAASLETEAQTPRVTRTSQRLRSASREVQVPSPRVSTRAMSRGLTTSPLANVTRLPESPRVSMGGHDAVEAIPEETHAADGLQQDAQQRDVNGETEATPVAQRSGRMTRAASRELSALQLDLSDATVVDVSVDQPLDKPRLLSDNLLTAQSQPWAKKRTGAETPSSQVDQLDSSQPITDVMPNGPNGNGEIIPASSQVSESTPRASRTARRSSLASTAPSETTQRARRSSRLSQTPSLPPSPVQAKSSSQPDPAIARKRPSESPLFMSQSQFPATQAYPAYPANILDSQIQTQNQTQESGSTRRSAGAKGSRASVRMTSPIQEEQEDGTGDDHTDAPTVNGHDRQETDGVPNGTEASESRFEGTHAHVAESRRTGESSDEDDDGDDDESTLPPTLSQRMLPVRPPPASQPSLSFPSLSGLDMSALRSGTAGKFSQNSSHSLRFSSSQPISSGLSTSTRGSRGGRAIKVIGALSQGASAGADAASDTDDSRDSSSEEEEEDPRLRGRYAGGRPRRVKTNVQKGW
jgi:serine/arginine repetitive matrix protein 2